MANEQYLKRPRFWLVCSQGVRRYLRSLKLMVRYKWHPPLAFFPGRQSWYLWEWLWPYRKWNRDLGAIQLCCYGHAYEEHIRRWTVNVAYSWTLLNTSSCAIFSVRTSTCTRTPGLGARTSNTAVHGVWVQRVLRLISDIYTRGETDQSNLLYFHTPGLYTLVR